MQLAFHRRQVASNCPGLNRDLDEAVHQALEINSDRLDFLLLFLGLVLVFALFLMLLIRCVLLVFVLLLGVDVAPRGEGKRAVRLQGQNAGERGVVHDEPRLELVQERD